MVNKIRGIRYFAAFVISRHSRFKDVFSPEHRSLIPDR
jgi:hypothetical protein